MQPLARSVAHAGCPKKGYAGEAQENLGTMRTFWRLPLEDSTGKQPEQDVKMRQLIKIPVHKVDIMELIFSYRPTGSPNTSPKGPV